MDRGDDEEENSNGSPAKPAPIKIPDHDIEVSVSSLPSLIGAHRVEDGATFFSGLWAMNDFSHGVEGQSSEFEFKLVDKFPDSADYPPSGKYLGWFHLKHPAPKPGHVKIDDKDTTLNFTKKDDGDGYTVVGEGYNKFGRFSIHGNLTEDGKLHVYKIFKKKPAHTPKASKSLGGIKPLAPGVDVTTPRVRRPSAVLSGMDVGEPVPEVRPRNVKHADKQALAAATPTASAVAASSKDTGRAQRLSIPMQKCSDVLKELSKQLQSAYFREPVDYVKLCIPDYATIVKQPMDFQTIQTNLEKLLYQSHDAFAEHVRLVFKNAITFNQRRDHPVHIAAREMSNRFEEKYRMLVSQLNNSAADFETNFRPGSLGASATGVTTGGGGGRGRGGGMRRQSLGGSGRGSGAGPREVSAAPPALDVNMQTLVEMQRQMKEMQTELVQIKNQLRQYDIKNSVEIQRQAAQDPMTLEEKQTLVERINRLDEERMKEIIDIIREMFPAAASGDGEDVDIPIDDLDTLTLRRLQSIVSKSEKETTKRKRSQSTTPKVPGAKRSKSSGGMAGTPKGATSKPQQAATAVVQPLHHDSSSSYNSNPFFGATDDDIDLLGGNDEPVSMDTGMPQRPASGTGTWQNVSESEGVISNADYSELMMEVAESEGAGGDKSAETGAGGKVLKNESAWTTAAASDDQQNDIVARGGEANGNGASWGEDVIQEKVNSQRLEENRKFEVSY
jgi:uncharacterized protein (UPF0335 family)